jgi:hypothetical protein
MSFDLNRVWTRGTKLVGDNLQLLIVIAGIFVLLPTIAVYLLMPDFQTLADPAADPEVVAEQMGKILGPLLGVIGILSLFQFAGSGAMIALIGPDRPTVAQALGTGIKIVPSTLAILIAFTIAYLVGAMIIMVPISILGGVAGSTVTVLLGFIPVLLFVAWLAGRMSMSMPVMVLDGTLNPFTAIKASFALTRANQWQIMMFWAVLLIIFTIISLLFNGGMGLIAALFGSATAALVISGFANGLTSMASSMIIAGVAAAMHEQLSGPNLRTIQDTFE